jgi:hypothetical protein
MQSMGDTVHTSRMMIIRIVLYKVSFEVYVANAGNIIIRIVSNRKEVSGQDRRIHASSAETSTMVPNPSLSLSLSAPCVAGICLPMVASRGGGGGVGPMKQPAATNLVSFPLFVPREPPSSHLAPPSWSPSLNYSTVSALGLSKPLFLSLACFGFSLRRSPVVFSPPPIK